MLQSRSVFRQMFDQKLSQVCTHERSLATKLCRERNLENFYFCGVMTLFIRCKDLVELQNKMEVLIGCFTICLKYCGPKWDMGGIQKQLKRHDIQIENKRLQEIEIEILYKLNWNIF